MTELQGNERACPHCDGTGRGPQTGQIGAIVAMVGLVPFDCQNCNGTGKIGKSRRDKPKLLVCVFWRLAGPVDRSIVAAHHLGVGPTVEADAPVRAAIPMRACDLLRSVVAK